ncbi:hypothetical protein [Mycoavidus sp. B2-EB]|uniref:hypothetical protein n=1 Tax=Mycoavidus sp. B2-EB TaxID=2651972 RepID=UPI0016268598|nr:hypothetical protein [Mycoavidus sp. B2-EB]BBO59270.1 hypothetical protein MPB2EB_0382 [Mycoavidus sp. B2-EB]
MQLSKVLGIILLQLFFVSACGGGGEEDPSIGHPKITEEPYFDIETTGNCAIRSVNWALGNKRFISPREYYEYMENQSISIDNQLFSEEQKKLLREHYKDKTKKYNPVVLKKLEEAFDKAKVPSESASFDPTFNNLATEYGLFGRNKAVEHVIDVIKFKFGLEFQTVLEEFNDALCAKRDFIDAKGFIILTNNHFDGFYKDESDFWRKESGDRLIADHISYIEQLKLELELHAHGLIRDFRVLYFTSKNMEDFQNALN